MSSSITPTLPLTSVAASDLQAQVISLLKTNFQDWTDTKASNNMIMLVEALAAIQELDYGYINRMAREAFIQFALDYRNVTAHARSLGYIPGYQSPSVVTAVINSASAMSAATVIPAGTQFSSKTAGIVYQTIADVTIPMGEYQSAPVVLWQWVSNTDNYTGTGAPDQQLTLNQNPVIPTSVVVKVNGVTWTAVDNFVDYNATDTVYTWTMDLSGNYTVQFGNGVSGAIVPKGATVSIVYNTGGGSTNAVSQDGFGACLSNVTDAGNGTLLSLSAYNALAAVPGADAETTAQIKARAPISARSPRCLLTIDDVNTAVSALPGVHACSAATWRQIPSLPRYMMEVFVVPTGLGAPSPDLVAAIMTLLTVTKPLVMGQLPLVTNPTYLTVNFDIQVFVLTGYNQNAVQNAVASLITSLFANVDAAKYSGFVPAFGMSLFNSVFTAFAQQIAGVRNVAVLSPGDTILSADQYPILGTINFEPVS